MLKFNFSIRNIWNQGKFTAKDYFFKNITLSKNKSFEIQISKFDPYNLVDFNIDLNCTGSDHAGPSFDISFYGYMFMLDIYDHRHWELSNRYK
jgi:hypothetical protein